MRVMCPPLIKIVLCTLMTGLLIPFGISRSLHVGSGHPYGAVKEAIGAASLGDTVIVHAGIYKEGNIIVDKTITLMGIDWPVLDGQLKYEVLSVKANSVIVTGLVVAWAALHPRPTLLMDDAKEVQAMIGTGKPVLLEFQSPY